MKNLFCNKLARCFRMKPLTSSVLEPHLLYTKSQHVATGDNCSNGAIGHDNSTSSNPTTDNDSVQELLKKIQELLKRILNVLETRVHNEAEQSHEADKEDEMKKDWMLAAAVLDRICAIAFAIIFIGGTIIFAILFVAHP